MTMATKLSLRIPNRIEELPGIANAVEALARDEGWPDNLSYAVVLALEEVATNVVRYGGHEEGASEIEIDVSSTDEEVRVEVRDRGKAFDPFDEAPEPDVGAALEDRKIGGLGVHFVRVLMDEAGYRREGGQNYVIMVKRRD